MAPGELGREVHVVADPSVEPAGCVVECDATRVDAQLSPALARVREVLAS
jgi:flagellar biosynthesis/type III secretory pathway protein FliH